MEPERCHFIIPRKNRTCRMLVKPNRQYCGEHAIFENCSLQRRIFCPLDPKHTVNESDLTDHLKVCNSRLQSGPDFPWIVENVNLLPSDTKTLENTEIVLSLNLKNLPDPILFEIVNKINQVYNAIQSNFDDKIWDTTEKYVGIPEFITSKEQLKHFHQQNSVVYNLIDLNLLKSDTIFIEFGAGKAKLAFQLSQTEVAQSISNTKFLLIEKSGSRYKAENKLKETPNDNIIDRFCRLRCGIEHVCLSKFPILAGSDRKIVALCKHLCGSAFDFMLNSVYNAISDGLHFSGAFLIPCCHHRIDWPNFTGQKFFLDLGIPRQYFESMCQMSSWATCGLDDGNLETKKFEYSREKIGRRCKHIIDFCRLENFKQRMGSIDKMISISYKYFVSKEVTPENLAIAIKF